MIGDLISEGHGKRTGRRILATQPQLLVEASFEEMTKLAGLEGINIGTYSATTKPGPSLSGVGEGVFSSFEGEMATWKGIGTGSFGPGGSVRYRGSLDFTTSSPKLASLNSTAVIFDFEIDAQGNTHSKLWALK